MVCKIIWCVYQKDFFSIINCRPKNPSDLPQEVKDFVISKGDVFSAKGYYIPNTPKTDVDFEGEWKFDKKYGWSFNVLSYKEILPSNKEGIIAFLSSGKIKGIGKKKAEKIVDRFGINTFEVMDADIYRLGEIRGINTQSKKFEQTVKSYQQYMDLKDIMSLLLPCGISMRQIEAIKEKFGTETVHIITETPYELAEINGLSLSIIDKIAKVVNHFEPAHPNRIKLAYGQVLKAAEQFGHLFLSDRCLLYGYDNGFRKEKGVYQLLNDGLEREMVSLLIIKNIGKQLIEEEYLFCTVLKGVCYIYNKRNFQDEENIAYCFYSLLENSYKSIANIELVDKLIIEFQSIENIILDQSQVDAVKLVFSSTASIITGGPGTGKTTILKCILYINKAIYPKNTVLLAAPTGRAAKRMSETTNVPAKTMDKALVDLDEEDCFEENVVVVDECSMIDNQLAARFFNAVNKKARVVLVGDVDQLPSVGAGNVFRQLINSRVIPLACLNVTHRQLDELLIIPNAYKINKGDSSLEFDDTFKFIKAEGDKQCAEIVEQVYQEELQKCNNDVDKVIVLSPFRKKLNTGCNELNLKLREIANPDDGAINNEVSGCGKTIRNGDKVMQIKNTELIRNGDIGYVRPSSDDIIEIDFGIDYNGQKLIVEYPNTDFDMLDLAYATTIHKSQGSEYPVVIIPLIRSMKIMLKRNLLYTAVTRGKCKVILVGEYDAIETAISCVDSSIRNTLLAWRLVKLMEHGKESQKENKEKNEYKQIELVI